MSEYKSRSGGPQLDPEMAAEFRAYGGIRKYLAASRRAHEQGGDALTKLRMPNGKQMVDCTGEYVERIGNFLEAVGRMVILDKSLKANATLRDLGLL
jgi:hypothetical protein